MSLCIISRCVDGDRYANPNGIQMKEFGYLKKYQLTNGKHKYAPNSQGAYTYVLNGLRYTVKWKANENGFQPMVQEPVPVSDETYESDELANFPRNPITHI